MRDSGGSFSHDDRQARLAALAAKFDDARRVAAAILGELVAEGGVSPRALVEAIGMQDLTRYLPEPVRARLLEATLMAGRRGLPFDDRQVLAVVSPDVIARALPLGKLAEVVARLTAPPAETPEALGDEDLAPPSLPTRRFDEEDMVSEDAIELVPSSRGPLLGAGPSGQFATLMRESVAFASATSPASAMAVPGRRSAVRRTNASRCLRASSQRFAWNASSPSTKRP